MKKLALSMLLVTSIVACTSTQNPSTNNEKFSTKSISQSSPSPCMIKE